MCLGSENLLWFDKKYFEYDAPRSARKKYEELSMKVYLKRIYSRKIKPILLSFSNDELQKYVHNWGASLTM